MSLFLCTTKWIFNSQDVDNSPLFYSQHKVKSKIMTDKDKKKLINIGEKLRFYRLEKGYSQEKFAELCELDRTYVSGLERGKRNPSYLIMLKILKVLEISSTQLFEGNN